MEYDRRCDLADPYNTHHVRKVNAFHITFRKICAGHVDNMVTHTRIQERSSCICNGSTAGEAERNTFMIVYHVVCELKIELK